LSITQNEFHLNFDRQESEIKLWKQRFETLKDSVYDLSLHSHSLKKEIVTTATNITEVHKDVLLKINARAEELNTKLREKDVKINNINKESDRSIKLSKENSTNINKLDNLIKDLNETFDLTRVDVNSLFSKKVENENYDKTISEINQRFRVLEFTMKTNLNTLIGTDE